MKIISMQFVVDERKMSLQEKKLYEELGRVWLFDLLLCQGLRSLNPHGVPMLKGSILSRIQKRLDACSKDVETIYAEETEFDLIKSVFCGDDARFDPDQYRLIAQIADNIKNATDAPVAA